MKLINEKDSCKLIFIARVRKDNQTWLQFKGRAKPVTDRNQ